jgi:HPt (histidine-containing phosphotransfer) domain-containing protein
MDDYLSKPIQRKEVAEMLAQWTQKRRASSASPGSRPDKTGRVIFDQQGLLQQIDNNRDLLEEVLANYLQDTPQRIHCLEEAISKKDAAAVRFQGHALKGTSGTIRALALQEVSNQMEMAGERGDFSKAQEILPTLRQNFVEFQQMVAPDASHL